MLNKAEKKALILHGYLGNPYVNWYPWLAYKLRKKGYKTWVPRLPRSSHPDGKVWTDKVLSNKDWDFDGSLIIGHSAGSVEILNLLSVLPNGQRVKTAVLVSALKLRPEWPRLSKLIPEPLNFEKIKESADKIILVHAINDNRVPLEDAKYYASKLNAELIILPTGGHFNVFRNISYWRFPELIEILDERKI